MDRRIPSSNPDGAAIAAMHHLTRTTCQILDTGRRVCILREIPRSPSPMSQDPRLFSPMFSIDVCTDAHTAAVSNKIDANELIVNLLKQLVEGQQQELKLLQEIAHWSGLSHKQRQHEITQWKDMNPDLARSCRIASEALVKVQNDYIHKLTEEAADGHETM